LHIKQPSITEEINMKMPTPEENIKLIFTEIRKMSQIDADKGFDLDDAADASLVTYAGLAMISKLKASREKGRSGWWREEVTINDLMRMLLDHIRKGDMRDVMNIAGMIYVRDILDGTFDYSSDELNIAATFQLDKLGALVQLKRFEETDEQFRSRIKAEIEHRKNQPKAGE